MISALLHHATGLLARAAGPDPGEWHDPTHGRIDRDIQETVDGMHPSSVGQRVALENTLQEQRRGAQPQPAPAITAAAGDEEPTVLRRCDRVARRGAGDRLNDLYCHYLPDGHVGPCDPQPDADRMGREWYLATCRARSAVVA